MRITITTGTLDSRVIPTLVRLIKGVSLCLMVVALGLCPRESYHPNGALLPHDSLDDVLRRGTLRVVSRVNPATFVIDENGPTGLEYELARAFAAHLGVTLQMLPAANIGDAYAAIETGTADLAASGLERSSGKQHSYLYSTPYLRVSQQVVYRSGTPKPTSLADLVGKRVMVLASSAAAEALAHAQATLPSLSWMEATRIETFELLKKLDADEIDYAVLNSNELYMHQGLFPTVEPAFRLDGAEQMSWATSLRARNGRLYLVMQEFLASYERSGDMDLLRERYFGFMPEINRHALTAFASRVDRDLPRLEKVLRRVGEQEGIDWRLLAAISYQESHWNPTAVSRTGVAGMMMLTKATAQELGVKDRRNMEQSLRGGARYYRQLLEDLPQEIAPADRTAFALAAYNMGPRHLEDARALAMRQGLDPNCWNDVQKQLPLLAKREWRSRTRYGYARGHEAASFVSRVRQYQRFLIHHGDTDMYRVAVNAAGATPEAPERS